MLKDEKYDDEAGDDAVDVEPVSSQLAVAHGVVLAHGTTDLGAVGEVVVPNFAAVKSDS